MKKLKLFALLIMTGCICSSQTLKPTLLNKDGDTLFAFSIEQSKHIAVLLSNGVYCDSIQNIESQVIHAQDSIIKAQKRQVVVLRSIIENDQGQITNLNIINQTQKLDVAKAQAQAKKQRRHTIISIIMGSLLSIVLAVN